MSEVQEKELAPYLRAIATSKKKFQEINVHNLVDYNKEAMFAMQAIQGNSYLMKIANENPESLRNAVINIAAIGLSLNPAEKLAYLVPRGGNACLDISYMGLVKLATDTGSIKWARAELVHENDELIYRGATQPVEFSTTNPFNRGDVVGVYCTAKTHDGDFLSGIMNIDELNEIRDKSEAYKKGYGPWVDFPGEMMKKTIIKRESKTWPKTRQSKRFDEAIQYLNEHNEEGIDFDGQWILGMRMDELIPMDEVNTDKVERLYNEAVKMIDNEYEDPDYDRCREIDKEMNQWENILFGKLLSKHKAGRKGYHTIFNECLDTFQQDVVPEHLTE